MKAVRFGMSIRHFCFARLFIPVLGGFLAGNGRTAFIVHKRTGTSGNRFLLKIGKVVYGRLAAALRLFNHRFSFCFLFASPPAPVVACARYFWRTSNATGAEQKFLKADASKIIARLLNGDRSKVYGAVAVAGDEPVEMNHVFVAYDGFAVRFVPVVL